MSRPSFLTLLLFAVGVRLFAQTDSLVVAPPLAEVEVVAVRTTDESASAPHYTLEADDFRRLNIADMASALHHLPGLALRDYGGAGGMKTVSVRGLGATHTGVSLDGLLLSDQLSGAIDMQQFLLSDLSRLQLSVAGEDDIFLPARSLQSGALLKIESADGNLPAKPFSATAALTAGSWQLRTPSLQLAASNHRHRATLGGSWLGAANDYPFTISNGIATHRERRANSRVSHGTVSANHRWQWAPGGSLMSTVRWSDNDRQLPGIVHYYVNENDETLRDRQLLLQSTATVSISERWRLKTSARWSNTNQDYHVGTSYMGIRSERYAQREAYATAAVMADVAEDLAVSLSADFVHNRLTTTADEKSLRCRNTHLQALSARWHPHRLTLTAHLLHSITDGRGFLSPAISASWQMLAERECYLRCSLKQSQRVPTLVEQYSFHLGTVKIQPETSRQVNLGLACAEKNRNIDARLTLDAYLNHVNDKIIATPYNMFIWRYTNLGRTLGYGLDATLQTTLSCHKRRLHFAANYSFQRIENRTMKGAYYGKQTAYTPQHSGSATLAWTGGWLNASATAVFASTMWATNEHHAATRIDGYCEMSATLWRSFTLARLPVEAALAVQNIADVQYCLVAHYPMPGRNVRLSLKTNF